MSSRSSPLSSPSSTPPRHTSRSQSPRDTRSQTTDTVPLSDSDLTEDDDVKDEEGLPGASASGTASRSPSLSPAPSEEGREVKVEDEVVGPVDAESVVDESDIVGDEEVMPEEDKEADLDNAEETEEAGEPAPAPAPDDVEGKDISVEEVAGIQAEEEEKVVTAEEHPIVAEDDLPATPFEPEPIDASGLDGGVDETRPEVLEPTQQDPVDKLPALQEQDPSVAVADIDTATDDLDQTIDTPMEEPIPEPLPEINGSSDPIQTVPTTIHHSHAPPPTAAAMHALLALEVKFAALRDRLYIERMEEAAEEEEMVLSALQTLHKTLLIRRERLHELASRRHAQAVEELKLVRKAEQDAVLSWWTDERDRTHWEEFEQTWSKRRRLAREKNEIESVRWIKPIPTTPKPFDWSVGPSPTRLTYEQGSHDLYLMEPPVSFPPLSTAYPQQPPYYPNHQTYAEVARPPDRRPPRREGGRTVPTASTMFGPNSPEPQFQSHSHQQQPPPQSQQSQQSQPQYNLTMYTPQEYRDKHDYREKKYPGLTEYLGNGYKDPRIPRPYPAPAMPRPV